MNIIFYILGDLIAMLKKKYKQYFTGTRSLPSVIMAL